MYNTFKEEGGETEPMYNVRPMYGSSRWWVPLVLGLVIMNSWASITVYFPLVETVKSHTHVSTFIAQLGTVASLMGITIGTIWHKAAMRVGLKPALILSFLAIVVFNSFSILNTKSFTIVAMLQLATGIAASAPLYLVPEICATLYSGLLGTKSGVMSFAICGGLALGPTIGVLAPHPNYVFCVSGVLMAVAISITLDDSIEPIFNKGYGGDSDSDGTLSEMSRPPIRTYLELGLIQGTLLAFFYSILLHAYYIPQQSGIGPKLRLISPHLGIIAGCLAGAIHYRAKVRYQAMRKCRTDTSSAYYISGIVGFYLSMEHTVLLLFIIVDTHRRRWPMESYYSSILSLLGVFIGFTFTILFAPSVSMGVDIITTFMDTNSVYLLTSRYLVCGLTVAGICMLVSFGSPLIIVFCNALTILPIFGICVKYNSAHAEFTFRTQLCSSKDIGEERKETHTNLSGIRSRAVSINTHT